MPRDWYFYPRPLRGGRRRGGDLDRLGVVISIHALCEEGDAFPPFCRSGETISIHALCEEGDGASAPGGSGPCYFYPRPLRGGRLLTLRSKAPHNNFYPRPLRGGRPQQAGRRKRLHPFLSTPSARRATAAIRLLHPRRPISIHALCEEGDANGNTIYDGVEVFLSTPSARRATTKAPTSP